MGRRSMMWAAAAALLAAVGLIAAQLMGTGGREEVRSDLGPPVWEGLPVAGMTVGPQDAPVLVEEYFDYQCPHCHTASEQIVKPFIERVVATGDARFAYRLFPILGPESITAARGAYCAAKQGKFWPFQDVLMGERGTGNRGTYAEERLRSYAERVGLELQPFEQCLGSDEAAIYVSGAYERGVQLGIPGTPAYFVNGRPVAVGSLDDLLRAVAEATPR